MRGVGRTLAVAAALSVPVGEALAVQWEFTPRVGVRQTLTDNVDLAPSGEEDSELITELRPGFSITGTGQRVNANLDYTLQTLFYARDDDRDDAFQRFGGSGEVEAVRDTFFIEGAVRRRQGVASLVGPIGVDNLVGTRNRQEVTSAEVSPYLVNRFGRFAETELRYRHSRTRTEAVSGGATSDSYSNLGSLRIDSGSAFQRFTWGTGGRYERVRGEDELSDGTFRSVDARVGWQLLRTLELSATGGYEDNEFETRRDEDDLSDTFWDVGVLWVPNRRTSIEARYGERFFGNTTVLNASYRARSAVLTASRVETISSERDQVQLVEQTIPVFDDPTCIEPGVDCEPIAEIPIFTGRVVNEFFIDTRTTAAITFTGRRSTLTLSGFQRERDFEVSEREEDEVGGGLSATWRLGPRSSVNFVSSYSRNTITVPDREDDLYNAALTFNRRFGESLSTFARVRHQARDSDDPTAEYRENAIIIGLTQSF